MRDALGHKRRQHERVVKHGVRLPAGASVHVEPDDSEQAAIVMIRELRASERTLCQICEGPQPTRLSHAVWLGMAAGTRGPNQAEPQRLNDSQYRSQCVRGCASMN